MAFLKSIKGTDSYIYKKLYYVFQLLQTNYCLNKELETYEKLNYNDISSLRTIFSPVYDSVLVLTEGETDISYIKQALKSFQKVGRFSDLKLRFAYLEGWVNVANLHKAIYRTESGQNIKEISETVGAYIPNSTKIFFVLDADDTRLIDYFRKKANHTRNFYLINETNRGYIEKCFDANLIKSIIDTHGYRIDPKKSKDQKTRLKLEEHLKNNSSTDDFFSINSYIVYKEKQIYKTKLAELITLIEDVDYSEFEDLFQNIHFKFVKNNGK